MFTLNDKIDVIATVQAGNILHFVRNRVVKNLQCLLTVRYGKRNVMNPT